MRISKQYRKTTETEITVELNLDERDQTDINTGVRFFDHMLEQLSHHGLFGLKIHVNGDTDIDDHHTVEDVGIVLGQAFREALADRACIVRYASARIPMDETLISVDIDLTTRPFLVYTLDPKREFIGTFDASLPLEFWRAFVYSMGLNLHIDMIRGENAHHIIEASYKAVAVAMRKAVAIDPRKNTIPSTKGIL